MPISRALWIGVVVLALVATGGLVAVGAYATSDRAAAESDFAVAQAQLDAQSLEFSETASAARDAMSTARTYSTTTSAALPTLGTGLDATLVANISAALGTLDDVIALAPGTGALGDPIVRATTWTSNDYRVATDSAVARLDAQRDKIDALSMSTDAVVAQTVALDQAVAALVSSLPNASATLLAERAKADQPSKDTLAAAAATAAATTTIKDALAGLAGYSNAAAAMVASHDAAVAAEAAAAVESAEQAARLAEIRARFVANLPCWIIDPSCFVIPVPPQG